MIGVVYYTSTCGGYKRCKDTPLRSNTTRSDCIHEVKSPGPVGRTISPLEGGLHAWAAEHSHTLLGWGSPLLSGGEYTHLMTHKVKTYI